MVSEMKHRAFITQSTTHLAYNFGSTAPEALQNAAAFVEKMNAKYQEATHGLSADASAAFLPQIIGMSYRQSGATHNVTVEYQVGDAETRQWSEEWES